MGANLLRSGMADVAVVGGAECISRFHLNGFNSLMILDGQCCRPFDASRAGLNLGEGAAYLILEEESAALRREAPVLGIVSGGGNACDAFHQTASSENGDGAFLAMEKALASSGLTAADIDYVNAHGTGTINNDASESEALRRVFKDNIPPVSSTKAYTGHTTSASGSIEAVFCLLAIQKGIVFPQLSFSTPDPACIIPTSGGRQPVRHVLCNSFGFGGNDSSLILSRYDR
jgi:3-oxoacyl-[acyl-carrier-protein] synthase-1